MNSRKQVDSRNGKAYDRHRPVVGFSLSVEADAMLEALRERRGMTRSALVEFIIREESRRERITDEEVKQILKGRQLRQTYRG